MDKTAKKETKQSDQMSNQVVPCKVDSLMSMSSYVASLASSAYQYMTTPSVALPLPAKTNKARIKTDYKDNVVASIALGEHPKRKPKPCKVMSTQNSQSRMTSMLSLFYTSPKPSIATKEVAVPVMRVRIPGKDDIDVKMKELVATIKAMDPIKDKDAIEKLYLEQVDLVEHEIVEHAQRRVDLYFYLLVAVYNLGARVEKKSTHKQHGAGTHERGTNGCHDSFFPHVKLKYPQSRLTTLWSVFVAPWNIPGTHYEDSNNMTSELPIMVNNFDTFMELATPGRQSAPSKYVKKCLNDLNLVSHGTLNPIDAMNRFLKNMKIFFKEFEEKLTENGKFEYPNVMRRIWELQFIGTLRAQSDEADTVDHEYICSLLRVPPAYVAKTRQDPSILLTYYCPLIQKEIYSHKSVIGENRKITPK